MVRKILLPVAILAAVIFFIIAVRKTGAPETSGFFPGGEAGLTVSTGAFDGGSLWATMAGLGRPAGEIAGLQKALSGAVNGRFPRAGDAYALALSTSGELAKFAVVSGEFLYELRKVENGGFLLSLSTLTLRSERETVSGTIESSLWESMAAKRVKPSVIIDFADIYSWEIDFLSEPRKGDRYSFVLETGLTPFGGAAFHKITAAVYSGEEAGEKYAYYYKDAYYRPDGKSLKRQFLRAPLVFRRISSYFNPKRYHPILRIFRPHNGIDYAAPSGTPVSAVADGTVSFAGVKGGYGKFIELRHGGTYTTCYGHLRSFARGIRSGKKVSQGEVIGYVGMTGLATGPHLDFSIKSGGRFVNFLKLSLPSASSLSGVELADFTEAIKPAEEALKKAGESPADRK